MCLPTFVLLFLRKLPLLLVFAIKCQNIFLTRKSWGCKRVHHLPTDSPGALAAPGLINVLEVFVHSVYFHSLFATLENQGTTSYIILLPYECMGIPKASYFLAYNFYSFSYFSPTFISLKLLLFFYFFI